MDPTRSGDQRRGRVLPYIAPPKLKLEPAEYRRSFWLLMLSPHDGPDPFDKSERYYFS